MRTIEGLPTPSCIAPVFMLYCLNKTAEYVRPVNEVRKAKNKEEPEGIIMQKGQEQTMKKTLSILLALAMAFSLGAAAFAEGNDAETTVPVYRESLTGDETVVLRMVGDIPYMRIDDYYNQLLFTGAEKYPQQTPESEGLCFYLSGRYKLMDKNNETVDFGVEPDYVLTEEKDGAFDYSRYFDFAEISRLIDEYCSADLSESLNAA